MTRGPVAETQAWSLRRCLTFISNRLANRPNRPRDKILRGLLSDLGIHWPEKGSLEALEDDEELEEDEEECAEAEEEMEEEVPEEDPAREDAELHASNDPAVEAPVADQKTPTEAELTGSNVETEKTTGASSSHETSPVPVVPGMLATPVRSDMELSTPQPRGMEPPAMSPPPPPQVPCLQIVWNPSPLKTRAGVGKEASRT